jgi:hypothetical protein
MTRNTEKPADPSRQHPFWTKERLEIWVRVGIPTVATLMLGLATIYIDQSMSRRAEREQSSRLYTELISRREQAASALRKDMFATILSGFLEDKSEGGAAIGSKRLDQDLMQLELLALNFGESLSLGPLFSMMDRRIRTDDSYANKLQRLDRKIFDKRLERLARRVADAQRGSLADRAQEFKFDIPSGKNLETGSFSWPQSDEDFALSCRTLGRVQRTFFLSFSDAKTDAKTVAVDLRIQTLALNDNAPESCLVALRECPEEMPAPCSKFLKSYPTTGGFTLDPFNLPLIDNSLLSHDQRFALLMRNFSPTEKIEIVGLLFPGTYAGRRDKLTLDQAIEELRGRIE